MDERLRLVAILLDGEKMAAVCLEFGISRNRYKTIGIRNFWAADVDPERKFQS